MSQAINPAAPIFLEADPAATLAGKTSELRLLQRQLRDAQEHKAAILRQLSLAEIAEREARQAASTCESSILALLGTAPTPQPSASWKTLSWDHVWCPHCKHTFVPSRSGLRE